MAWTGAWSPGTFARSSPASTRSSISLPGLRGVKCIKRGADIPPAWLLPRRVPLPLARRVSGAALSCCCPNPWPPATLPGVLSRDVTVAARPLPLGGSRCWAPAAIGPPWLHPGGSGFPSPELCPLMPPLTLAFGGRAGPAPPACPGAMGASPAASCSCPEPSQCKTRAVTATTASASRASPAPSPSPSPSPSPPQPQAQPGPAGSEAPWIILLGCTPSGKSRDSRLEAVRAACKPVLHSAWPGLCGCRGHQPHAPPTGLPS